MLLPQLFTLLLAVSPAVVQAGLFPKDTLIKQIDARGFKKAMKQNVSPGGSPAATRNEMTYTSFLVLDDPGRCVRGSVVWRTYPCRYRRGPAFLTFGPVPDSIVNGWRQSLARLLWVSILLSLRMP